MSNLIFLTGAPLNDSLDWSEEHLITDLSPPYVAEDQISTQAIDNSRPEADTVPVWRRLDLHAQNDSENPTNQQGESVWPWLAFGRAVEAPFLKTADLSFNGNQSIDNSRRTSFASSAESEEILSQFYEHSFAIHEDVASSQIIPEEKSSIDAQSAKEVETFARDGSLVISSVESSFDLSMQNTQSNEKDRVFISLNGLVIDIKNVPTPAFLQRTFPQTITVNLVVGIISIEPPRYVKTRRGQDMEIVELLTGDETRAGFGVNFWLSPIAQQAQYQPTMQDSLRASLSRLRRQDTVLIKNVALGSFRGKVYGQSLRRDQTKIELLHRLPLDALERLEVPQLQHFYTDPSESWLLKAHRVAEWVQRFVGPALGQVEHGSTGKAAGRCPPVRYTVILFSIRIIRVVKRLKMHFSI